MWGSSGMLPPYMSLGRKHWVGRIDRDHLGGVREYPSPFGLQQYASQA
jgi:hypothetical protein